MSFFESIYVEELPPRAKMVLLYLKDRAGKKDSCWPAIPTIAADLSLSTSTVKRALRDLYRLGLADRKMRYRENGSNTSNLFTLYDP